MNVMRYSSESSKINFHDKFTTTGVSNPAVEALKILVSARVQLGDSQSDNSRPNIKGKEPSSASFT